MVSPTVAGELSPLNPDDAFNTLYASYVPHDLKYSADFEDSLADILLDEAKNTSDTGLRVIPEDSDEQPREGVSIRETDVLLPDLPGIAEDELPLPLNDPRRIFTSAIPGIKLTHPGGYLEGGPGLDPEMDTFLDDFIGRRPGISNARELDRAIQREVDASVELLRERMRARQRAKEKNEQIEKEIRALVDQHSMELKIQRRMAEEQREKREARGRRTVSYTHLTLPTKRIV